MGEERNDKIIEKIRKLLALAGNNSSEYEAAAAAEMARKLLDAYNLNISALELNEIIEKRIVFKAMRYASWKGWVGKIVSDVFDCHVYLSKTIDQKPKVVFIGNKADCEVAFYVYTYLLSVITCLQEKKVKNNTSSQHGKTIKFSYTMGIVSVLKERLETFYRRDKEIYAEEKNAYGMTGKKMMVIKNDAIERFIRERNITLKNTRHTHKIKNENAYNQGIRDGEKISLTHGIS